MQENLQVTNGADYSVPTSLLDAKLPSEHLLRVPRLGVLSLHPVLTARRSWIGGLEHRGIAAAVAIEILREESASSSLPLLCVGSQDLQINH